MISLVEYQKIQGQLSLALSQIKYKNGQVKAQATEINQLMSFIKDMHH